MKPITEITANERPHRSVTPDSGLRANSLSDAEVDRLFDALTDRERLICTCLNRAQSQRGLASLSRLELLIRTGDALPILQDVPDYALPEAFRLAVRDHDYRQPFQVQEVYQRFAEMSETTRQKLYEQSGAKALPEGETCEWCNGTGRMRALENGIAVTWNDMADTRHLRKCYCKGISVI